MNTIGDNEMGHGTEGHSHEPQATQALPPRTMINHGLQLVNTETGLFVGKCVSDADWLFLTNTYKAEYSFVEDAMKPSGGMVLLGLVKVPLRSVHYMVQLNPADWAKYFKD
jgi:hypothetical protein